MSAVRLRISFESAEDYTQGFISSQILETDLMAGADKMKGRFRSYLLTALDRYLVSVIRHDRAKKRRPAEAMLDLDNALDARDLQNDAPGEQFDRKWAREVVGHAIERMKTDCLVSGREDVWLAFSGRILLPTLEGAEPVPVEQLVEQLHLESAQRVSNLLITGKRSFQRAMRDVVGQYELDPAQVDAEIEDLQKILSGPRKIGARAAN